MGIERIICRGFLDRRYKHFVITSKRNIWANHGWIFFFDHWLLFMLSLSILFFFLFFFFIFFFSLPLNSMHWNFTLKEHFFFFQSASKSAKENLQIEVFNSMPHCRCSRSSAMIIRLNVGVFANRVFFCPSRFSFFYPIYPSFLHS